VEEDRALELEFYTELPKYEVRTDSIPVEIVNETIEDPENMTRTNKFMLQTGAFQAQESADRERQRQADLGLNVIVKLTELSGRNLYLVQAGPYASQADLEEAREVLSAHDISTLTIQLQ
jgi:cell division protein FtsN